MSSRAWIMAVAPSPWQQTLFATVALVGVVPMLAMMLLVLRRLVFEPRAHGRMWPEGAGLFGWARIPAEFIVDLTRVVAGESDRRRRVNDAVSALCFGLPFVALATIPLSAGLIAANPTWGLYVVPGIIAAHTLAEMLRSDGVGDAPGSPAHQANDGIPARLVGGALVVAGAGVVHLQWASARLFTIAQAQANAALFGFTVFGLPTWVVQAPTAVVLCGAAHVIVVGNRQRRHVGGARMVTDSLGAEMLVLALAAWLAVVVFGGPAVPFSIANDGLRHVVGIVLVLTKTMCIAGVLVWSSATWPQPRLATLQRSLGAGLSVVGASAIVTVVALHLL